MKLTQIFHANKRRGFFFYILKSSNATIIKEIAFDAEASGRM